MVVEKEKLKKKLLDDYFYNIKHTCSICRQTIGESDIRSLNFEYCETVDSENYAHATCIKTKR